MPTIHLISQPRLVFGKSKFCFLKIGSIQILKILRLASDSNIENISALFTLPGPCGERKRVEDIMGEIHSLLRSTSKVFYKTFPMPKLEFIRKKDTTYIAHCCAIYLCYLGCDD